MSFDISDFHSSFHLKDWFYSRKYSNTYVFPHFGFVMFSGEQGAGKSLSVNRLVFELLQRYPEVTVVSNIDIPYCDYIPYKNADTIRSIKKKGIILILDEICNLYSNLESKEVSAEFLDLLNMMRKRELLILGTAPVFARIAKPFREQFSLVCICKRYGCFQVNKIYKANIEKMALSSDEDLSGDLLLLKTWFFFHSPEDYKRYDTNVLVTKSGQNFDFSMRKKG